MMLETLKSGSPQSVVTTLRACEECLDHSAQQSCDCTVALLYPRAPDFSRAETGDRVYCVRSEKSGGVGYLLRSTPLFAFPAGPGAGPETASPREPPCREPQRIYLYCNGEGDTLCTNDRGMCSCTPLPLLFCPPVLGQERSAASPCPPHLHLDNGTHHYDLLSDIEAINRDCRFSILR